MNILQVLNLSENQLKSLPSDIPENTVLRELDLSYNALTQLPPSLWKCQQLTQLSLESNLLTTLPNGISALKDLSTLSIGKNPLESIPIKEILTMPSLRDISIVSRKELERRREEAKVQKSKEANSKPELKNDK
jgi:Leucine-rich repeat (LRR) protein